MPLIPGLAPAQVCGRGVVAAVGLGSTRLQRGLLECVPFEPHRGFRGIRHDGPVGDFPAPFIFAELATVAIFRHDGPAGDFAWPRFKDPAQGAYGLDKEPNASHNTSRKRRNPRLSVRWIYNSKIAPQL
jgi:hypothetical protein